TCVILCAGCTGEISKQHRDDNNQAGKEQHHWRAAPLPLCKSGCCPCWESGCTGDGKISKLRALKRSSSGDVRLMARTSGSYSRQAFVAGLNLWIDADS